MIEAVIVYLAKTPLGLLYSIGKDLASKLRNRKRRLTPQQVVSARQKWKTEVQEKLIERRSQKLRTDVIVRDMRRIDTYPNIDNKKGISAWFRCGMMDTYHRGIMLGLGWHSLKKDKAGWRFTNYKADEIGDVTAVLVGYVTYETIDSIDWDGDEYGGFPHIYCYFNNGRSEPYERLAFCEKRGLEDASFYAELALYDPVRKLSKKLGTNH